MGDSTRRDLFTVVDFLVGFDNLLLAAHIYPDGDSIGSLTALAVGLTSLGKTVRVVSEDPVPRQYRFLTSFCQVAPPEALLSQDLSGWVGVILDCNRLDRLGKQTSEIFRSLSAFAVVDHHQTEDKPAEVSIVDTRAAATGEIVYRILQTMGVELGSEIATSLYVAISTDTGSFKFSNTTSATHAIAANLVAAGADPGEISEQVYDTRPLNSMRFLAHALSLIQVSSDGLISWICVDREAIERYGIDDSDTENLVSYARSIEGVVCALLFRPAAEGLTKVSFRCKRGFRVDSIAARFGGGGHMCAAGATVDGTITEVRDRVLAAVSEELSSLPKISQGPESDSLSTDASQGQTGPPVNDLGRVQHV